MDFELKQFKGGINMIDAGVLVHYFNPIEKNEGVGRVIKNEESYVSVIDKETLKILLVEKSNIRCVEYDEHFKPRVTYTVVMDRAYASHDCGVSWCNIEGCSLKAI